MTGCMRACSGGSVKDLGAKAVIDLGYMEKPNKINSLYHATYRLWKMFTVTSSWGTPSNLNCVVHNSWKGAGYTSMNHNDTIYSSKQKALKV